MLVNTECPVHHHTWLNITDMVPNTKLRCVHLLAFHNIQAFRLNTNIKVHKHNLHPLGCILQ